ncbi:hypothetical protein C8F01DRAFT_1271747 [Mycena amicta]|nr:hypothetical protein C8F01DRAFT_1271747 [Mycena amicta]
MVSLSLRMGCFAQTIKHWWSSRTSLTRHFIISIVLTILVVGLSFGITQSLILGDVNDQVDLTGSTNQQISLIGNFQDVDATARTMTVDWYPLPFLCSSPEMVVNIFVDPNLLVASNNGKGTASDDPPATPIFQLNTTEYCFGTDHSSFPVFRTTAKLAGINTFGSSRLQSRSLQAYPFDVYFSQISMFASLASTNESVGIFLEKSFGIPINFDLTLDKTASANTPDGFLLSFKIKRSGAVIGLVILILAANWLVTIAFLWITVAAFMWDSEIVKEMFVLPIGALFAFTSVRANLPGAPAGFGAIVDYYGILPNLALMTLCSAVLLIGVLYRRVRFSSKAKAKRTDVELGPICDVLPPASVQESILQLRIALQAAVTEMQRVVSTIEVPPPSRPSHQNSDNDPECDVVPDSTLEK